MTSMELNVIELLSKLESLRTEFDAFKTNEVVVETPTWEAPSFIGGWTDYDSSHEVSYSEANGRVHMKGWMKDGSLASAAFTLPTGYRPSQSLRFPVYTYSGGTVSIGSLRIDTDGSVIPNTGYTDIFSVDNVIFWADGS